MILKAYSSTWPPRRLPSRMRLARVRLARVRRVRPVRMVLSVTRRLTLWAAWITLTAVVFLLLDRNL